MAKNRGLGRGLDALLGGGEPSQGEGERLLSLRLSALQPGKYQPRTNMHEDAIAELAESIKAQGLIQPILARQIGQDRYEIIAGERRWRAAQRAGLQEVPVVVRNVPDESALAMALIENIQRENLNAIEEANGIQRLVEEFGMTHQAAADAVGRSRSAVSNLLRLLALPTVIQSMLSDGRIEMGHARALLPLDPSRQLEVAHQVVHKGLSVREAERAASAALAPASAAGARRKVSTDVRQLEEELSDLLGTRVEILSRSKGSGKLVVHFSSLDQLDSVLTRLR